MLGAQWWRLSPQFEQRRGGLGEGTYDCDTLEECFAPDIRSEWLVAWPEVEAGVCYVSVSLAEERGGETLRGWYNALNMEERCGVILGLGGKRYFGEEGCGELEGYLADDWEERARGLLDEWGDV